MLHSMVLQGGGKVGLIGVWTDDLGNFVGVPVSCRLASCSVVERRGSSH